nr:immunoglobulin heavy chain junction region [Mus musculus]
SEDSAVYYCARTPYY